MRIFFFYRLKIGISNIIFRLKVKIFKIIKKCACTKVCDCQNPPPDDWDGKDGIWHISEECSVHNLYPAPNPECLMHLE